MTRSLALWAGCAALLAVVVAAVTVAVFPRESRTVQLLAIPVARPPAAGPPVAVNINAGSIGTTAGSAPTRRGAAAVTPTSGDPGVVGFKQTKKVVKRQTLIGASSGPNGDSGFAAGAGAASGVVSQSP
jgi:hypothetical protein